MPLGAAYRPGNGSGTSSGVVRPVRGGTGDGTAASGSGFRCHGHAVVHGEQEERCFHGYYDGYCYLPLYVFCGRHLLVSYLRPSGIDPARRHAWAILSLLMKALRAHWPQVEIVFRGDSGFFADGGCRVGVKRMACALSWGLRSTPVCTGRREALLERSPVAWTPPDHRRVLPRHVDQSNGGGG